ncbi:hypothetical protein FEZ33_01275 [Ruoffia tabacinasalis]|uniref:Uncharacterized protein n=1 Tax=Ruoffia tabacinasalis TaxID=87458 RepID=A0A5R9EGL8_9LACT|nr:hypothetical protein [Ruoffia tabacinasalis]TLQ49292.1 hypothetical protein FEZ33_01275 [Ruoffia tabacinasalis]
MEQELTNMLELLRQGLSELPAIGSDVFNTYARGIQVEGGVTIAIYLIIILSLVFIIRYLKYKSDELDTGSWATNRWSENLRVFTLVLSTILIVISILASFGVYRGVMKLLSPEYMLIKEVIGILTI